MQIGHARTLSAFSKAVCWPTPAGWQELLHRRLQLEWQAKHACSSIGHHWLCCIKWLAVRCADLAGLYRGGCITLLRDVPAHAIYFTSYELCHELFEPGSRQTGNHSPAALFISGMDLKSAACTVLSIFDMRWPTLELP